MIATVLAFLVANPDLVASAVGLVISTYVSLSKRWGGERFHLMKQLGRVIAKAPRP